MNISSSVEQSRVIMLPDRLRIACCPQGLISDLTCRMSGKKRTRTSGESTPRKVKLIGLVSLLKRDWDQKKTGFK